MGSILGKQYELCKELLMLLGEDRNVEKLTLRSLSSGYAISLA